jgi:alpha-glucosidase
MAGLSAYNMRRSLAVSICFFASFQASAAVPRIKYISQTNYLIIEILQDDLIHFEISGHGPGPDGRLPLYTSPQVLKKDDT